MATLLNTAPVFNALNWFRTLSDIERRNLEAFTQFIAYCEMMGDSRIKTMNPWKTRQGFVAVNSDYQHPEGCNAVGKALGPFQIEGTTWCSLGFNGKKLSPENQTAAFISMLKQATKIYNRNFKAKDKSFYHPASDGRSAYDNILAGKFDLALDKVRGRYKSLVGSGGRVNKFSSRSEEIRKIIDFGGTYTK